jgi:hypothetical protein
VKRIKQYVAAKNEIRAIGILRYDEIDRMEVSRSNSLIRFIDGGPPKLAVIRRNHQIDMAGNKDNSPFVRNSLRV